MDYTLRCHLCKSISSRRERLLHSDCYAPRPKRSRVSAPVEEVALEREKDMRNHDAVILNLHPLAVVPFSALAASLRADNAVSCLRPFEGTRSPEAQNEAFNRGNSQVGAWRSVHQYGFAVDFVPWDGSKFHWWNASDPRWDALDGHAAKFGLKRPISWDSPHIVMPNWKQELIAFLKIQTFT